MIDATGSELGAIEYGGEMGGEYLDEIKVYDVSKLTKHQWDTFIGVVIAAYLLKMADVSKAESNHRESESALPY